MSTTAWLNWEVQVSGDDPTGEVVQGPSFCIVKDDDEEHYVAEVTADQFMDECQGEEAMQNGQWQMVRMSQVTKQAPSNVNTERVQCSECQKTFSSSAYMREHMRVHTGEKPYSCDECDLAFAQKCNLRMHKRIHTGERPFMCAVCGRTFSRSSHLKGHMLQHTGAKPYSCETCGQQFTNSQGKKNHMKLHLGERPFQCEICNVTFAHKPSLKIHIKTHSRESRYYCSICKRKFVFRSGLYEHMTFHSKNKLYECDQCHKRFKQKNYLKKHKSTICVSRSLLSEPEHSSVREPSQLKYRVLSANEKAQPRYVDSDEEDEERTQDETARMLLQQHAVSEQLDEVELLDPDWIKVLRRLATNS